MAHGKVQKLLEGEIRHCSKDADLITLTNLPLFRQLPGFLSYNLLIYNKIQQSSEDGSYTVTTKFYSRQHRRDFIPLAAVCTDGISSLMFKTSGHLDSIVWTKKWRRVDLLSEVLVLLSYIIERTKQKPFTFYRLNRCFTHYGHTCRKSYSISIQKNVSSTIFTWN